MPYIDPIRRELINHSIQTLIHNFKETPVLVEKRAGVLNYIITKLLIAVYDKPGYQDYNEALGVLSAVAHEFYRRRIAPYEDKKREEMGDVFPEGQIP